MGQKFAAYAKLSGEIIGFYDSEDSPLPVGMDAIKISEAEWISCISSSGWRVVSGKLVPPEPPALNEVKSSKIAELTKRCASTITGGYTSNALGAKHFYPSDTNDQINMMGSVSASLLPGIPEDWSTPFWCMDENGDWARRLHSAAEIQTAGADGKAHVIACQAELDRLSQEVAAATTAEIIASINWPQEIPT